MVVFGGGSFGTAIGCALARQKPDLTVTLLLRDPQVSPRESLGAIPYLCSLCTRPPLPLSSCLLLDPMFCGVLPDTQVMAHVKYCRHHLSCWGRNV